MARVRRDLSDDGSRLGGDGWRLGLPGAAPPQHYRQRTRHDLQVLADGLVSDVFEIVAYLAPHVVDRRVVPLIDLRPARDTGADALTPLVALDLLPQVDEDRGLLGPGSDQIHVAPQHVEELGEFVQPEFPQHATDRRDARVVGLGPDLFPIPVGPGWAHRAELVHGERYATLVGVTAGGAP